MDKTLIYKYFLLFCFGFFSGLLVRAQDNIQFKNYTIDDGLSQSTISCVIQDQIGAMWLGTQDGINRFNGKNFEVFTVDEGYDVSSEYINTSFIDKKGDLWFGTSNGLTNYNIKAASFSSFPLQERVSISSIAQDDKGNLWVGTVFGKIYKFNTKSHKYQLIDGKSFRSEVIAIRYQKEKLLFVSEFEGVLRTDISFNKKTILRPQIKNKDEFLINGLIESPIHDLVISTNEGVFYYNELTQNFSVVKNLFSELKNVNIIDAIYLSDNRLIAASENSGLYQITKNENNTVSVLNYSSDIFQKGTLISNKLTGLFKDNQGIIWITSQQGLSSFNPHQVGFKGVGVSADPTKGLPAQNVWGFAESKNQRFLYIATDKGVSCYDRKKQYYYHYNRESIDNEDFTALSIQVVSSNTLLVGCVDGLFELVIDIENPKKYTFTKLTHPADVQRGFDLIYTIKPFKKEDQYLIGTKGGIILFDYNTRQFHYLYHQKNIENSIGLGACRFIFNLEGDYYTSPSSGGIYLIRFENGELKAYFKNKFSFLNNATRDYFTDFFQINKQEFWFATLGDGVFKLNLKTKKIIQYDKANGLPNNVVYGIEGIGKNPNFIWLSTNKGVVAIKVKDDSFYSFTEKDGLMSNEFNIGASFVSKNGEIYFGSIEGINYFKPSTVFYINNNIKVFFSEIEIENKTLTPKKNGIISQNIAFTNHIKLPYDKRSLKLRFFANDLSNPDRIQYKYVMTGGDEIKEDLGSSNQLRFTSLAPGIYELSVYARTTNGKWTDHPAQLTIEVERPFWLTWWFYLIILVIIALFVLYRVRKSIETERRRQVRLEMRIADRTRELRKKNEKIQEQKNRLEKQTKELEQEKEKSERILNNILPKETASQLKKDGRSAARDFKVVSIMFTDFVGFSKIAEKMSAKELVSVLDKHFREFDKIIDKNNLEKIKTIGDAYMCAGGVPIRNKTHPVDTTLAAVQIKDYMQGHRKDQIEQGLPYWKLRIGINTGSVSAGVIGTKRYAYDIWGSAVNHAQRMEQLCEPGKIAITQDTFDYIEPYFECNKVGRVKTKSGAKIMMYEIVSIKPELSVDGMGVEPNDAFQELVNLHHYSKINYYKAERFIMSKLKKELSPKLHYHSYQHSKDVTRQVERIAIQEGITDEDLFLLKSAASYHDAGFVEQYEKNEPVGARMAAEILPKFGYSKEHLERIKELIYVTQVPHHPKNKLEEIICDADLDYLGREDFHEISDRLRRELREHGKIDSNREWDKTQVKFFKMHRYFTKTSIETRLEKKKQNLEEIKQRIKEDNYDD